MPVKMDSQFPLKRSELTDLIEGLVLLRAKHPQRLELIQPLLERLVFERGCTKCGSDDWMEGPEGILCLPCADYMRHRRAER